VATLTVGRAGVMPVRSVIIVLAALVGVASAWLPAGGQQAGKVYRVGFLTSGTPGVYARSLEGFKLGLRELGYVEGQNIVVDYRFGEGSNERAHELAAELVRSNVDIIVASAYGAFAAKKATTSIPIVFLAITDPIRFGYVSSLARPGGNMTGLTYTGIELNPKRLQVLSEALPRATRFAALGTSKHGLWGRIVDELQTAARSANVQLQIIDAGDASPAALDAAFETINKSRPQGLLVLQYHQFVFEAKRVVDLATRYRIPAMYELRLFPDFGGLMSYAGDITDQFRRAAIYVDKILKGAKPAELPVEQPTKFELVINNKAARALGLTIPPSLLLRADHLIE
jgi:putative tryptophan/tyrosine transport system substrate-binding protein